MNRPSWKKVNPAIQAGIGFPAFVTLSVMGTLAVANNLDSLQVPLCIPGDGKGALLRIAEVQYVLQSLGGTSGSTAVRLVKNGDTTNGVLDSTSIAYNATQNYVQKDLRDSSGKGITLQAGDSVRVDVTAIPGTASANLKIRLVLEVMDIAA
jgi:hypothetical protein